MDTRSPVAAASTRVAAVIGSPVRHSRSPALVNAAFAAAGLDWVYVAYEVAPGHAVQAVAAMRTLGLAGLSVTMPHKQDVIAGLDRLSPAAEALVAVNCIAWDGDQLIGHNTDGIGLVSSLRRDEDFDPAGCRCVVLGAGGAARSIVLALADAGAAEVAVLNRTRARGEQAAALAGTVGRVAVADDVRHADLVVNATSVGMGADEGGVGPMPLDRDVLVRDQVVVDLVYQPRRTPLLAEAERRGARPVDGLGMLVHQAAVAVQLWTGVVPDTAAMTDAARSSL